MKIGDKAQVSVSIDVKQIMNTESFGVAFGSKELNADDGCVCIYSEEMWAMNINIGDMLNSDVELAFIKDLGDTKMYGLKMKERFSYAKLAENITNSIKIH